jgi:uncharacterized membrane protein YbaN (DUF454 family)
VTLARSAIRRWLLRAAGLALVGLAAIGVIVPGLPTTPLLLLAAAAFARSSPRLHAWLLANPVFGPLIREWQETRTVPARAKVIAIGMIILVGGSSLIFFVHHPVGRVVMAASLLVIMLWLAQLPSRKA